MRSFLRPLAVLPFAAALLAGCAATHDDGSTDEQPGEGAEAIRSAKLPAPAVASQRLYFDAPQPAYLTDDAPLTYWVFGAKAGHEFKTSVVATTDGHTVDANPVGFKLFYLLGNRWQLLKSVDGPSGEAVFKFTAKYDHVYLIEAGSATKPVQIQLSVGCDHAACALAQQPGDFCGGIAAGHFKCDDGLFCQFAPNTCTHPDAGGTCVKPSMICPLFYKPVCGCDGITYGNTCQATSAKTSVAHDGACVDACESKYSLDPKFSVASTSFSSSDDIISYQFDGKNGVTTTNDPCVHSTCKIMVRQKTGTVKNTNGHLVLTYTDGTIGELDVLSNCKGAHRLTGSDWGSTEAITVDQKN
jgi:hypothetical protein